MLAAAGPLLDSRGHPGSRIRRAPPPIYPPPRQAMDLRIRLLTYRCTQFPHELVVGRPPGNPSIKFDEIRSCQPRVGRNPLVPDVLPRRTKVVQNIHASPPRLGLADRISEGSHD